MGDTSVNFNPLQGAIMVLIYKLLKQKKMRIPHRQKAWQAGQVTVEFVLLLTFFVIIATVISNNIRAGNWAEKLVKTPWSYLSGMIESGAWVESDRAREKHPVLYSDQGRFLSVKGKPVEP